jgi:hypothetical protein
LLLKNKTWYKSFDETKTKGEVGEDAFIQLIKGLEDVILYDVREFDFCRKRDIDFIVFVYDEDDKITCSLIEIKTEFAYGTYSKEKQRFYIEDISSQKQNSDGWYRYTQCDIMANFDAVNKIMYYFKFEDLKEYIELFYKKDNKRVDYIKIQYSSAGYVVNIKNFYEWLQDNNKYNKVIERG